MTSFLMSRCACFGVSNLARRRLRIPSVFTMSKSIFLAEAFASETKEGIGWPRYFRLALAAKEAPYSPRSLTCQTLIFTFFAHAIKGMEEPKD